MTRRSLELMRLADWPRLDEQALDEDVRSAYRSRCAAIEAYAQGERVASIETEYGIDRSTLFRMIKRAQRAHADGSIWGYRALVPHVHVAAYERSRPPRTLVHTKAGNAGAFTQLLQRHPAIEVHLRRELSSQHVQLNGAGEAARLFNFKPVLQRFLQACREQWILQSDYPFNQKDKGVRTLARTLRAWLHERFDDAAHAAGARFKPSSAHVGDAFKRELPIVDATDLGAASAGWTLFAMYWCGASHPAALFNASLHPPTGLVRWISQFHMNQQRIEMREIQAQFAHYLGVTRGRCDVLIRRMLKRTGSVALLQELCNF